jgi:hypothetical protein
VTKKNLFNKKFIYILIEQLMREITDLKIRLQRFEADNSSLQQEVISIILFVIEYFISNIE